MPIEPEPIPYGLVKNTAQLGRIIRLYRKSQALTLTRVSNMTRLSVRFLSELERGKETAEIGKALSIVQKLGLEISVHPRGYSKRNTTI